MSTRTGSLDFGSRSSIENVILDNKTTDPSVVAAGLFYYNTVTGYIRYCNGGAWMNVEHQSNRVNVWSDVPSTIKYPSEKLTKDSLDTISLALSTHNHNLNDLAEKSYDSLTDKPSLNFEPANANIQSHIGDGNIHVTTVKTAAWDAKLDVSTVIPSLDTIDKMLTPAINEVNAIAKGAGNGETITDITALVTLLNNALPTDYPYGKNFYVVDTEVPDYWISAIGSSSVPYVYVDDTTFLDDIAVTGSLQVGYYSISELETQKVNLTDYYDKNAADLLLGAKEDITNKSSNIETDKTSITKYPHVKAIYDWAVGKFIDLTKIVTTWSAIPLDTNLASEKLVKDEFNVINNILFADGINVNKDNGLTTVWWFPTNTEKGWSFNVSQITDSISPFVGLLTYINQCSLTRTSGGNCYLSKRIDNIMTELISEISLLSYSYWIKDSEWTGLGASVLTIQNALYGDTGYDLTISYDLLKILNEETVTGTITQSGVTCSYEIKSGRKLSGWTQIIVNWKNINWITTPEQLNIYMMYNPIVSYLYGKTWHIQNHTILINSEVLEGLFVYRDGGTVEGTLGKIAMLDERTIELEKIIQTIQGIGYGSFNYNSEVDQLSYILTNYNETNYLKQTFKIQRSASYNECFNFEGEYLVNKSTLSETSIKNSNDDICPCSFNGTYIGANHGNSSVRKITCTSHGKSFVDIGSKWSNGTNNFYIINIADANSLWVLGENLSVTDTWNFAQLGTTTGTLTHVENATNTGNIVFTNAELAQLKPSNKIISRSIYADDKLIETTGTYNFNELNINEEYDILDPSSVLTKIIAAVGTFTANPVYNDLDADPVVRMSLSYKYKDDGTCLITTNFITYKDITIDYFGFIQAVPMHYNSKLYIPKALPILGKDFREIEDWGVATYTTLNLTSDYWENAELPPDRFILSEGTKGFAFGFLYDYGVGGYNKKNSVNNSLFLYLSGKTYPHGIDDKLTIVAGEGYSATCFRKHLTTFDVDGVIGLTQFEHENKYYIYADFNAIGIYEIEVPNKYIGKNINVFEKSSNVTVLWEIATEKILIDVATASPLYGYAVLKIS